jgi:hypothetical protein
MRFRVINTKTGEVMADLPTGNYELAKKLADKFYEDSMETFDVVQCATVYRTRTGEASGAEQKN